MGSFHCRAAYACAALGLVVLTVAVGTAAARRSSAPVITLVAPSSGATVVSSASSFPTFRWQVSWDAPEATTLTLQVASDAGFTQNVKVLTQACPATNVNCWTSAQLRVVFAPPYGTIWYWRVTLATSAGNVSSPTSMFTAVNPPPPPKPADRDKDGVPDGADNCPDVANSSQQDSNHDHVGDACQADKVRPQLRVPSGHATRGKILFASFSTGDDRGSVRMHATFSYEGHVLVNQTSGWRQARVGDPQTLYSLRPIPRAFPTGIYEFCVKVWDRAGNNASGCGKYTVS
jgi:hypothetical protein